MGISGRLEDLSAADALQFFHMSARSGELTFESEGRHGWLALRHGRITGASMPGQVPQVGNLLCELTGIHQSRIDEVLAQSAGTGQALGAALIEAKVITTDQLRIALTRLIRMVVAEVVQWKTGTFAFEPGGLVHGDGIAYVPEELLPDIAVDVQDVLLDALRSIDEAARTSIPNTIPSPPHTGLEARWSSHPGAVSGESARPHTTHAAHVDVTSAEHTATQGAPTTVSVTGVVGAATTPSASAQLVGQAAKAKQVAVVLTSDGFFRYGITSAWADATFSLKLCGLEQEAGHDAAELVAGGADVVALIHASGTDSWSDPTAIVRCVRRIKSLAPNVPILVIGCLEQESRLEAFRLGVRHVLEMPEFDRNMKVYRPLFETFVAGVRDALSGTFEDLAGSDTFIGGATSDIKKLASKLEGLRRSTEKRAVALGLLEYVAENVERAVMFLVAKDSATVIGAFGTNGEIPLSELLVGMKVSYQEAPVLRNVVDSGQAFRGPADPALIGCSELFQRAGRPRTGHAVFLPVRGVTRVFAALYLDNGSRTVPLVSTEALQILAAHAGLMLENLALQRATVGEPRKSVTRIDAAKPPGVETVPVPARSA